MSKVNGGSTSLIPKSVLLEAQAYVKALFPTQSETLLDTNTILERIAAAVKAGSTPVDQALLDEIGQLDRGQLTEVWGTDLPDIEGDLQVGGDPRKPQQAKSALDDLATTISLRKKNGAGGGTPLNEANYNKIVEAVNKRADSWDGFSLDGPRSTPSKT